MSTSRPWRDESTLRRLYVDERITKKEVGDRLGCSGSTILHWMTKYDIETRTTGDYSRVERASYHTSLGYPQWSSGMLDGDCTVHQLLACLKYEPSKVFDSSNHIHHKNTHKFDNRLENLELMSTSEHMKLHQTDKPWRVVTETDE